MQFFHLSICSFGYWVVCFLCNDEVGKHKVCIIILICFSFSYACCIGTNFFLLEFCVGVGDESSNDAVVLSWQWRWMWNEGGDNASSVCYTKTVYWCSLPFLAIDPLYIYRTVWISKVCSAFDLIRHTIALTKHFCNDNYTWRSDWNFFIM